MKNRPLNFLLIPISNNNIYFWPRCLSLLEKGFVLLFQMPELVTLSASGGTEREKTKRSSTVQPCRYDLAPPFSRNGGRFSDTPLDVLGN